MLSLAPLPARAESEAGGRLALMVRSLIIDYRVKRPDVAKAPLAVFDFACPEALARQRVGYAVAELIKTKLVGAPEFAVLERSELERILHEQALQQTGVVNADTAVQLGKVVGAALAISGNVDKMGGAYQVSARLADVATGEVLAIAVQEFPARVFEAEAQSYLNLVPEEQAIGLYVGFGFVRAGAWKNVGPVSYADGTTSLTDDLTFREAKPARLTVGVRYQPQARWLVDVSLTPLDWTETVKMKTRTTMPGSSSESDKTQDAVESGGGALTVSWVQPAGTRFRVLAGAGLTVLHLSKGMMNSTSDHVPSPVKRLFARPHVTAAVEWRPQRRLGFTLSGIVWLTPDRVAVSDVVRIGADSVALPIAEFDLPVVGATLSTALYF